MSTLLRRLGRASLAGSWPLLLALSASAQSRPADRGGPVATVETTDGRRLAGRVAGDASSGFLLVPGEGPEAIPLEKLSLLSFEGPEPDPAQAPPPFGVTLGLGQHI